MKAEVKVISAAAARLLNSVMTLYKVTCVVALLTLLTPESRSQLDVCGRPALNTRIVGGQVAPEGSWPWQASVHRFGSHSCGGSLINSNWVLSAAHCYQDISSNALRVYLGRQSQEGNNSNEVSQTVTQIINHPNYNNVTFDNDVSLLRLSSSVNLTNFISPVCLAAADSIVHNGTDTWVTGWGTIGSGVPLPSPQNLMEVEVPIVGNRQCNCDYGVGAITNNMICAGLQAGGKDACQGDSGGPLVSKQNGLWILLGIVSFGKGCARPEFPGVYARVSQYQSWINSQISSNPPGFITFTSNGTDGDLNVTCPSRPPPPTSLPTTTTAKPVVCGQAPLNSRILGGNSVATAGMWPWMASLQKNGSHVCGGTLVSEDSVLSSASCFSSSPVASEWTVVLGRLNQNSSNPFEVTLNVTNITLSNLTGSNVAVLSLAAPPALSDYIQAICLDNGRTFPEGSTCWAAGWSSGRGGEEQVLQELQTSVVNCGNASSSDSVCTGTFTLEQGDSGGPLMCKLDGSWFQAAVLLAETNSTRLRAGDVMVFTKLSRFQTFLSETLGSFLSPASTNTTSSTSSSISITSLPTTTTAKPVVCGQALLNSRILGGNSVATAGIWPWMASLQKNGSHVCGGTLVSEDSVLSSASCFSSSPVASEWTVVLGRLNQNGSNPFEVTLNVTNITLSNLTGSNVAVLSLAAPPALSNYIQAICLDNGRTFPEGSTCWAAGWSSGRGGEEQVLQEFQTSVVNCGDASSSDSVCTGTFTLEQGDSGGPLMCKVDGSWFQAAVLLAETNSTRLRAGDVMVFTKLSRFQTFLSETLGSFLPPASTNTTSSTSSSTTNTTSSTSSSTTYTTSSTSNSTINAPTASTNTTGGAPAHSPVFFFNLLISFACLRLFL